MSSATDSGSPLEVNTAHSSVCHDDDGKEHEASNSTGFLSRHDMREANFGRPTCVYLIITGISSCHTTLSVRIFPGLATRAASILECNQMHLKGTCYSQTFIPPEKIVYWFESNQLAYVQVAPLMTWHSDVFKVVAGRLVCDATRSRMLLVYKSQHSALVDSLSLTPCQLSHRVDRRQCEESLLEAGLFDPLLDTGFRPRERRTNLWPSSSFNSLQRSSSSSPPLMHGSQCSISPTSLSSSSMGLLQSKAPPKMHSRTSATALCCVGDSAVTITAIFEALHHIVAVRSLHIFKILFGDYRSTSVKDQEGGQSGEQSNAPLKEPEEVSSLEEDEGRFKVKSSFQGAVINGVATAIGSTPERGLCIDGADVSLPDDLLLLGAFSLNRLLDEWQEDARWEEYQLCPKRAPC